MKPEKRCENCIYFIWYHTLKGYVCTAGDSDRSGEVLRDLNAVCGRWAPAEDEDF